MSDAVPALVGRRVTVTGLAGSGKSTFALALAAKTGLPVIHLDLHFWKPGWVAPSETEWREKQCGLLAGNARTADGNYHETLDLRLGGADTDRGSRHALVAVRRTRVPARLPNAGRVARRVRLFGLAAVSR